MASLSQITSHINQGTFGSFTKEIPLPNCVIPINIRPYIINNDVPKNEKLNREQIVTDYFENEDDFDKMDIAGATKDCCHLITILTTVAFSIAAIATAVLIKKI